MAWQRFFSSEKMRFTELKFGVGNLIEIQICLDVKSNFFVQLVDVFHFQIPKNDSSSKV